MFEKNKNGRPLFIACSGGGGHIAAINAIIASYNPSALTTHTPVPYKKKAPSFARISIFAASYLNYSSLIKNYTKVYGLPVLPNKDELVVAIDELEAANKTSRAYIDMLLDVYPSGYESAAIWNVLQRQDEKEELTKLVKLQSSNDEYFFTYVSNFFLQKLNAAAEESTPYTEIISTQAIGLPALCDAVKKYNKQKKYPRILIDQYMTDLPTKGAVHFFNALATLPPDSQACMSIHAVNMNETIISHFFPNGCLFNKLYNIEPKKNPMIRKGFCLENDNSQRFDQPVIIKNEKDGSNLEIIANEKVASIMLGSQAGADTEKYIDILLNHNIQTLFVFCGSNTALKNKLIKKYESNLDKIILLGNQDDSFISSVMTRSNILIIRAGGLSVMEQMAMNHNDDQIIMIHHAVSESYSQESPVEICKGSNETVTYEELSEPEMLQSGISWEDDNADLLIKILKPINIIKTSTYDATGQLQTLLAEDNHTDKCHTLACLPRGLV